MKKKENEITIILQIFEVSSPPKIAPDGTASYSYSEIKKVPVTFISVLSEVLQHTVSEQVLDVVCNFDHSIGFDFHSIVEKQVGWAGVPNNVLSTGITADVVLESRQIDKAVEIICYCFSKSLIQGDMFNSPSYKNTLSNKEEQLIYSKLMPLLAGVKESERYLNNPIRFANALDQRYLLNGFLPCHTPDLKVINKYQAEIIIEGIRRKSTKIWIEELRVNSADDLPLPGAATPLRLKTVELLQRLGEGWINAQWHRVMIEVLQDRVTKKLEYSITELEPLMISQKKESDSGNDFGLEPST